MFFFSSSSCPVDFGIFYVVFTGPDDTNDAVLKPQEHLHLTYEISFCVTFDENMSAVAKRTFTENIVTALIW